MSQTAKRPKPPKWAHHLLRALNVCLLALTFLLAALAGHFYEDQLGLFWVFVVPAIAVGVIAGYFSEKSIKLAIADVDEHVADKIAEITKQFDEKIQGLQSQLDLKSKTDKK